MMHVLSHYVSLMLYKMRVYGPTVLRNNIVVTDNAAPF